MKKNKIASFLLRDVFSMTRLTASSELILFSLRARENHYTCITLIVAPWIGKFTQEITSYFKD